MLHKVPILYLKIAAVILFIALLFAAFCAGKCDAEGKYVDIGAIEDALEAANVTIGEQVERIGELELADGEKADVIAELRARGPRTITRIIEVGGGSTTPPEPAVDLTTINNLAKCKESLGECDVKRIACQEALPGGNWILLADITPTSLSADCEATLVRKGPVVGGKLFGRGILLLNEDNIIEGDLIEFDMPSTEVTVVDDLAKHKKPLNILGVGVSVGKDGSTGYTATYARFFGADNNRGFKRYGLLAHVDYFESTEARTKPFKDWQMYMGERDVKDYRGSLNAVINW